LCPKADGDQHDDKEFEEEDLVLRVEVYHWSEIFVHKKELCVLLGL
jgi:hypothetical protein